MPHYGIVTRLLTIVAVMTDYLPEIVRNAHVNARSNDLSERVSTAILDWTTAPPIEPARARVERPLTATTSTAAAPPASVSEDAAQCVCRPHVWARYDLILAADVVYAAELVSPLICTLAASLSSRGRAHVVLPPASVRFCIADFEKQAGALFSVQKRAIKGQDGDDLNYYSISWPANELA